MGLGSKEPPRRKIYYCSPRSMDADKKIYPHFSVATRENGVTKQLADETAISGYLVEIRHGKYEYKGDTIPTISLLLVDGDEMFKVEANCESNLIRSLMNTVIGTRDFDVMRISLYSKKNEKGEDQAKIYISNNDQKTQWAFEYEKDIKPLIEEYEDRKKPGKMLKDYRKVDAMLRREWEALEKYVADRAKEKGYLDTPKQPTPGRPAEETQSLQEELDGIKESDLNPPVDHMEPVHNEPGDDLPF